MPTWESGLANRDLAIDEVNNLLASLFLVHELINSNSRLMLPVTPNNVEVVG